MKLWVDDERPAPEGWERVESSREAIELLQSTNVTELSLDYCLKNWDTGDAVLYWLAENRDRIPGTLYAHSSSASGCALLERIANDLLGVEITER